MFPILSLIWRRRSLAMRNWVVVPALLGVGLAALALPMVAQDDPLAKEAREGQVDKDRAKVEKQLAEMEAQRAKLDSQIRDLRRKLGRSPRAEVRVSPRIELRDLNGATPETRVEVERALQQAHRAVAEALKNVPDVKALVPDIEKITGDALKVYVGPDGTRRVEKLS